MYVNYSVFSFFSNTSWVYRTGPCFSFVRYARVTIRSMRGLGRGDAAAAANTAAAAITTTTTTTTVNTNDGIDSAVARARHENNDGWWLRYDVGPPGTAGVVVARPHSKETRESHGFFFVFHA